MYSRDPFNLRKAPPTAFTLLQSAATKTIETGTSAVESTKQALKDADMSFAVPRNVPNFETAQRRFEDNVWGRFTGNEKGLPMYKDKPAHYGSQRGVRYWIRRRRGMALLVLLLFGFLYWVGWRGKDQVPVGSGKGSKSTGSRWGSILSGKKGKVDWEKRKESVRDAFLLSWNAYEQHGWGRLQIPRYYWI